MYYIGEYGSSFETSIAYQNFNVEETLSSTLLNNLNNNNNITLNAIYSYKSVDNSNFPTRGMHFKASGYYSDNLDSEETVFAADPKITFWSPNSTEKTRF